MWQKRGSSLRSSLLASPGMEPPLYSRGRDDQGPSILSDTVPEVEPPFHDWGLSRRESHLWVTLAQNLASATGSWGRMRNADVLLLPESKPSDQKLMGEGALCAWL